MLCEVFHFILGILTSSYFICTIILLAILCVGVINVRREQEKYFINIKKMDEYNSVLCSMLTKQKSSKAILDDKLFLIRYADDMEHIVDSYFPSSIYDLKNELMIDSTYQLHNTAKQVTVLLLQAKDKLNNKITNTQKEFRNPFTLFYRGIGAILTFVFGYLIDLFIDDFNYEGKMWKRIVAVVSLLSMILTIAGFF